VNFRPLLKMQGQQLWAIVIFSTGTAILAILSFFSEKEALLFFALYTIPSHVLISPFPHEPMLLWVAKFEPPWSIAAMGTVGACLAGLFDYLLLVPLFFHYAVRSRYEKRSFYLKPLGVFKKFPFSFLVVAGISPLPFFPFKFISIAGGYPLWKYQAALVVGRTPRYYLLAWLGRELHFPDWVLILLAMALFTLTTVNIFRRFIIGAPPKDVENPSASKEGQPESHIPNTREESKCRD
jgi:membrane protein YqaA with SNARE-associated domain